MFILLSGLSGAQGRLTVEDRIGETLRTSGVGITITSLTDFLAFMAGAISNFLAVKNFCIYTGKEILNTISYDFNESICRLKRLMTHFR